MSAAGDAARRHPPRPCPICGKPAADETRPFCSVRCADVDLHRWLGGSYVVRSTPEDERSDAGETPDDD